jgi:hypothetical protein
MNHGAFEEPLNQRSYTRLLEGCKEQSDKIEWLMQLHGIYSLVDTQDNLFMGHSQAPLISNCQWNPIIWFTYELIGKFSLAKSWV